MLPGSFFSLTPKPGALCCKVFEGSLEAALDAAAFGRVLVRRFPQATTGDLSPERTIGLVLAIEQAAEEWIENNVIAADDDDA